MQKNTLTDENDYIPKLVPPKPPALILAKFCDEPQPAILALFLYEAIDYMSQEEEMSLLPRPH